MTDMVANLLAQKLIARPDVKAIQRSDGSYNPERGPFTRDDLRKHIDGKVSYGHYLLSKTGHVKLFAFDLDFVKRDNVYNIPTRISKVDGGVVELHDVRAEFANPDSIYRPALIRRMQILALGLATRVKRGHPNVTPVLTFSGSKGMHVLCLYSHLVTAAQANSDATQVLRDFDCFDPLRGDNFWKHRHSFEEIDVEVFPKQTDLEEGKQLGNLMRLPLGINQKSGNGAIFVKPTDGDSTVFIEDDAELALSEGSLR